MSPSAKACILCVFRSMSQNTIDWAKPSFLDFLQLVLTDELAVSFAVLHGLIDTVRACACGRSMAMIGNRAKTAGFEFECYASRSICGKRCSLMSGSWFYQSRLGIRASILVFAAYAADLD